MEDGIGSGGLWPSDLLHCDDNNLVRSGVFVYYDDGDCNDGDELYCSCSFSDIQLDNIFSSFAKTQRDAESEDFFDNFDHAFFLTLLNPEPLLAQVQSLFSRNRNESQF